MIAHRIEVDPVECLLARLEKVKPRPNGTWQALCPAHDDRTPSLNVKRGDDGRALVICYANCPTERVLAAIGLTPADLFPPSEPKRNSPRLVVARYDYRDERGDLLYQVERLLPKGFRQRRPDGNGGWVYNLNGTPRVPYRLPELLAADPAEWVFVAEGEKDCDALAALGLVTTCNAGGAGQWSDGFAPFFAGRRVAVVPDNDEAGRDHAEQVARALHGTAAEVRLVALPDLPPKGDAYDWLAGGGDADALRRFADEAPVWEPTSGGAAADAPNPPNGRTTPEFPVEVLPPAARRYVVAAAESIPVPVEMVAVPLLGAAGALLGNRLHLALKPSWREYPTLYLAVVAPPGAAKSPALKLATWPLDVLQRAAIKRYREEVAAYEADLDAWKKREPGERGDKPAKPVLRHYFSSNLTVEALVAMLERSPGVAIVRDEILSWVKSMDQYRSKGSDRQEYLSLWAGGTIKADRKGGEPVYRPHPVACVVGGIQPEFVPDLHDEAQRRDGFVERVLPIVPEVGAGRWTEATIEPDVFGDLLAVFEQLDRLSPADNDDDPMKPVGIGVQLHPDAKALWVAWHDENAALVEQAAGLAAGFAKKLPAHVARLALILHALWRPDDPRPMVSAERMADAIEVGEFFRAHLARFLPLLGAPGSHRSAGTATRVRRVLRTAGDGEGWVSRSTILNKLRTVPADELSAVLAALLDAGEVERRVVPGPTKPSEQWRLTGFGRSEDSDYPPSDDGEPENSESSERPNRPEANGRPWESAEDAA